jgi:general secretion pathway protein G
MGTHRENCGLTLIEMLIVVAVIALLASILLISVARIDNQTKEQALREVFVLLEGALQLYYEDTGKFPQQPEQNPANAVAHIEYLYVQLSSIPASRMILDKINESLRKNKAGALDKPEIYDPWGTALDYIYGPDDTFPELVSAGKDRTFGTPDDTTSRIN